MKTIQKNVRLIFAISTISAMFLATPDVRATLYTSAVANGNWNSSATWNPAGVPGAGDIAAIAAADPVTVNDTEAAGDVTIQKGATLTIATGGILTVSTNITQSGGTTGISVLSLTNGTGTLNLSSATALFSSVLLTNGTAGATVNYTASGATVYGFAYDNLTLTGGGTVTVGNNTTAINLTLSNGSSVSINSNNKALASISGNVTVNDTSAFTIPSNNSGTIGGSVTENGSSIITLGASTTVGGNFTLNNTARYTNNNGNAVLTIAGSVSVASGASWGISGSGNIFGLTLTGSSQTISGGGTLLCQVVNITGSYTLSAGTTLSEGTINAGSGLLEGTGSLVNQGTLVLNYSGTYAAVVTISSLNYTATGNTLQLNEGNGGATTLPAAAFYNISYNPTGGADSLSLSSVTSMGGNLTIGGNNGPSTSLVTAWPGTGIAGEVIYTNSASKPITFPASSFSIGGFNQSSAGTATVPSGGTLKVTGTGASAFTRTAGTFTTVGGTTVSFTGAIPIIGGSVGNNFANLSIATGTTATNLEPLVVTNILNVASNGVLDVSALTTYNLAPTQTVVSAGTIVGNLSTTSTSKAKIYAETNGIYSTNTIAGSLTLGSLTNSINLNLSSTAAGSNDMLAVNGTLALNSTIFNLSAPSSGATIDTNNYILVTATNITGTPVLNWVTGFVPANVAHYSLVVSNATNIVLVYTPSAVTTTALTLSSGSNPSTYGGSLTFQAVVTPTPNTGTVQFQTNGVNIGSAVPLSSGTATLTTAALPASAYTVTAVYSGATLYLGSTSSGLSQTVNQAALTITGLTGVNKVYDGTTSASFTGTPAYSGLMNGDSFAVSGTPSASFASASVGNGVAINVTGYTAPSANYTLAEPTLGANITPAPVTVVSGLTAMNMVYDGSTAAMISSNNAVLSGVVAGDVGNVSLSTNGYTATFASANVGTGINVGVSGLTLTGSAAANYMLTQPTLSANITPVAVTIASGLKAMNLVYNGGTAGAICSNNVVLSGVLAGDNGNVSLSTNGYTATFASANVGTGISVSVSSLTLTGSASGNYTLTQPTFSANITPATVTITSGLKAMNLVYNGNTAATICSNNVVLSGVAAGDVGNVSISTNGYTATFASANVGTGISVSVSGLTLTGSAAANYTLTQPTLSANITPVTVTVVSGLTAMNLVYNGNTAAIICSNNVVLSGVLAGDVGNVSLSTNGYTATFASADVGTEISVGVSGLSLTGSASGNYTLTQPTLSANITPATVTVVSGLTAMNMMYNGSTAATICSNNVVLDGIVAGDAGNVSLSTNGYTAAFASPNVGMDISVTVTGLTLTGSAAANYTLTQPTLSANITPMTVTVTVVSGLKAMNKVYNGSTAATICSNNVVLNGVAPGDVGNVSLSTNGYTATFASANVGTGISVGVTGLTLTGSAAANYALVQPTLSANITPAAVTVVSGLTAMNLVYNGSTTAMISSNNVVLSGVVAGDVGNVSLATNGYTATFASANVGTDISVGVSGLSLTGSAAANYTLTQPTLNANITPVAITITSGLKAMNLAYDGNTAAAICSNNVVLSGVLAGDSGNVSLSTNGYTATFASANVGTGINVSVSGLTLTGSAAGNYTLIQPTLSANITPATVTIASGLTAVNLVYNGNTAATISSNNVVLGGVVAGDVGNVSLATNGYTATFASANVGTGISVSVSGLSLTGSAAGNYTLTQPTLSANITPATVTIASGLTAVNLVYDGGTAAMISSNNVVLSGVVAGDVGNVSLATNGYTATFASANVGTSINVSVSGLSLTGSAAANYALTQPTLSANITPATVTIASGLTAMNLVYNGNTAAAISSNNVVLSGIVAGDVGNVSLSTNGYTATFASANVGTGISVSVTGLSLTGSAAANYTLTQPTLSANITPVTVTVVSGLTAMNLVYNGNTAAIICSNNVVLSGVLAGDSGNVSLSTNGYTATFGSANVGTGISVSVTGLSLTGSASANYMLTQPTLSANITPVAVTIASGLTAMNLVYNGNTAAAISSNNVVLSGVLAEDSGNASLSTNGYTATFASANVGTGISVSVSGLSLTGSAAANYTLTQPTLSANITPATVTIASGLKAMNLVYNGSTAATICSNNIVLSGVVAGDVGNVLLATNGYTATFASANVGTGISVSVSGLSLTGSASANYTLTQPTLSANITPASLSITANNASKIFGQTVTFAGTEFTTSGLVNDDSVSSVTLTSAGATNTAAVGSYSIVISGATGSGLGNYDITYTNGTLTVTAGTPVIINNPMVLSDGTIELTFTGGNAEVSYEIQASTDLVNWTTLTTIVAGTNGLPSYIDIGATNNAVRFYRTTTP